MKIFRRIFLDENNNLRHVFWAVLAYASIEFVGDRIGGFVWAWVNELRSRGHDIWFEVIAGWPMFIVTLLVTWACLMLFRGGRPLWSVGLNMNVRWLREYLGGVLFGSALVTAAALLLRLMGGFHWEPNPAKGFTWVVLMFWGFIPQSAAEELQLRGFFFQRLVSSFGMWPALWLQALLFGFLHWGNGGLGHPVIRAQAMINIVLAGVLFGVAYLRTHSLALPMGIHLGWNWVQGSLLGFPVSGGTYTTGPFRAVLSNRPEWLTGGKFGLEGSFLGILVILIGVVALWRWKGGHSQMVDKPVGI